MSEKLLRVLIGGGVALLGLGFLLDGLGVWSFSQIFDDWWPLLIILGGFASLYANPRMPLWPLFIVVAGVLLLLQNLAVIDVDIWQIVWPAALVVAGLTFVLRGSFTRPHSVSDKSTDTFLAFSGLETSNTTSDYSGGKINVVFGGVELDLREAKIKQDNVMLEVFVAFGGVEIRVPKEWEVRTNGLPLFGGWEDTTSKPTAKKPPVLEISGTCIFGGVEIKN